MHKILEDIRNEVPALGQEVYGKPLVYFDNAATAHKPKAVIEMINTMNSATNSNIHRAVHKLSADATILYENSRDALKAFINSPSREQIIFTSGTTASVNLCAYSFSEAYISQGDSILISESEHHSNIVPWQLACQRKGANLKILPVDQNGEWRMDLLDSLLDESVKLVAVNHCSNVLGIVNPIKELIDRAHKSNIPVFIDGAQGIVHQEVDVQELDCDFYAFSGHKLYAATGIGVLYGKKEYLENMPPYMGGGDMVGTVTFENTTWAELPLKFEAGTPNFIGAASFAPALEYVKKLRAPEIVENEHKMFKYLREELKNIEGLTIYGDVEKNKIPLFSFNIEGVHNSDLALLLDKMGVAVRSGYLCAEPLISKFGLNGLIRASLAPYNTMQECEIFINSLKRAITMLR